MQKHFYDKHGNIIDFYTIFNIPYDAQENQIKTAFRSLIKRYHPDTAEKISDEVVKKIDLIIQGYRILCDSKIKEDYDNRLFERIGSIKVRNNFPVIPKKRIKYSANLGEMLKARFLPRRIKRKDILYNFGQDIEIIVTAIESKRGALAYIELPARMYCPLCAGQNSQCYVCNGIGRISTTAQLEVKIPPGTSEESYIDVDLSKMKPDGLTRFRTRQLRIKISIIE